MTLSADQVRKIGKLCRIRLTREEEQSYAHELSKILDWVSVLQKVDTGKVPELYSVVDAALPLREDVITEENIQPAILANAPAKEYGYFTVPKVVE